MGGVSVDLGDDSGKVQAPTTDTGKIESVKKLNHFGLALLGVAVALLGLMAVLCGVMNDTIPTVVLFPPYVYVLILTWCITLDKDVSTLPLKVGWILSPLLPITQHASEAHRENIKGYPTTIVSVIVLSLISAFVYRTFTMARRCLQKVYSGSTMISTSIRMATHVAGSLLPVLYLTINNIANHLQYIESNEVYASHTPYCTHTPFNLGYHNSAFRCVYGEMSSFDQGEHLWDHAASGISKIPVFHAPNISYSPIIEDFITLEDAYVEAAHFVTSEDVNDMYPTSATTYLSYFDFVRLASQKEGMEAAVMSSICFFQNLIVVALLFIGQVLLRVCQTSFDDVLSFRIARTEAGLVASIVIMLSFAILIGSLPHTKFARFGQELVGIIILSVVAGIGVSYKICRDIIREKHAFIKERGRRMSSLDRVSEQGNSSGITARDVEEAGVEMKATNPMASGILEGQLKVATRRIAELEGIVKRQVEEAGVTKIAQDEKIEELRRLVEQLAGKAERE